METSLTMNFNQKIGITIKKLREKQGLTLEKCAFVSDFSKGGLSEIERGLREIKISSLEKFCKTLEISLSEFFAYYEKQK